MDSEDLKSKQDILQVIDKLYDKDTREEALTGISCSELFSLTSVVGK